MEWAMGIDCGGTALKAVAVTPAGHVLRSQAHRIAESGPEVWQPLVQGIAAKWREELGEPHGFGVAAPGLPAKSGDSIAWMLGRRADLVGVSWTRLLSSPRRVPVVNDAQGALLGENWLGAAQGLQNCILLTLGTGVGGAAMVDGRVLRGAMGRAGHLGHISLDPWGPPAITLCPGSLEWAIGDATVPLRTGGLYPDSKALAEAYAAGEPEAQRPWLESVDRLAAAIASFINILDPEVVILGGGVSQAGPALFEPLRRRMEEVEWTPFEGERVRIVPAALGGDAGALGAARLAWRNG